MNSYFDKRLFVLLSFAFAACTVIGTLSHELGHFLIALFFGEKPKIHFASSSIDTPYEISQTKEILIILGGVMMTLFIGFTGFAQVMNRYFRRIRLEKLELNDWLKVLLTMFLLREPFNFVLHFWAKETHSDEQQLATLFSLPQNCVSLCLSLVSIWIIYFVIFKFVPRVQRLSLLLGAFVGSTLGYLIWFHFIGPLVLP